VTKKPPDTPRIAVVVPTYNNALTAARVVRSLLDVTPDVIVVDDGSTDGADKQLAALDGVDVVTHETNLGKGAAIKTGFARAIERGYSHAVTFDADGQHSAEDVAAVFESVRANPSALVVGVRRLPTGRRATKSRLLRFHSNFWVWTETGRWVSDTQSGLRAYPLSGVGELALKRDKYDFEIEALVKLMWRGCRVVEVSVGASYGEGSKSHFRPLRDFLLVAKLNFVLFMEAMFLPSSLRENIHLAAYEGVPVRRRLKPIIHGILLQDSKTPGLLAASVGVGVFFGILPIWGFQMAAAFFAAHLLKLSKAVVLLASNISIPAFMPFIIYASIIAGRLALGRGSGFSIEISGISVDSAWQYALEYIVGAVVLAVVAGTVSGAVTYLVEIAAGRSGKRG
jgi:glycosyltransferase involved in cell wall biosynthesis